MSAMDGFVSHYWAQGMEEGEWLVFQEAAHVRRRDDGSEEWAMEGMWPIEPGASLTIFAEDGSVLWSGTLALRRTGLFGVFGRTTLAPPGIEEARWLEWFHRVPPLKARYESPRGRPGVRGGGRGRRGLAGGR